MEYDKAISLNGQNFIIHYVDSDNKNAIAHIRKDIITIKLPRRWPHSERARIAESLEKRIVRRLLGTKPRICPVPAALSTEERNSVAHEALPKIIARIRELNSLYFNSQIGKIRIKSNLTNWGSCSAKNNISINFALLFLPQGLLDYVIVHELSHTKVRNHSARFWHAVRSILPEYKVRKKELRKYTLAN